MNLMRFENCSIGYDSPLLSGLNLNIRKGEFISVLGQTGIGKSTLLRLMGHVDRKNRKPKVLNGKWIFEEKLTTGIVFQSLEQLLPWKTALDNVVLPALSSGLSMTKDDARVKAVKLLDEVGLSGHQNKYPANLSGGMRQRVAIARAMLLDPELLLMDEPFGSLDAITRNRLQDMLMALHKKHEMTVLFITHDIDEAVKLSTKILVIDSSGSGQVFENVQSTSSHDLKKQISACLMNIEA